MQQIGPRLRTLRTDRALSRERLAALAGISSVTVYRIERGTNIPDLATVAALADALDVTVVELIDGVRVA